ncbi:MAG: hypothetical protein BWY67_00595 [Bacteroidetes bacterium ADurb.Bin397]|jgi:hypothetical protein|nr:MAG: hypothetical protein BWY67_00595 [Bacteroidetes bacterium ADurb.Bin397]
MENLENTEAPNPDYLKGFNEGYLLSKENPELTKSFIDKLPYSDRSNGFKDGWKQTILEKSRDFKILAIEKRNDKQKDNKDKYRDLEK